MRSNIADSSAVSDNEETVSDEESVSAQAANKSTAAANVTKMGLFIVIPPFWGRSALLLLYTTKKVGSLLISDIFYQLSVKFVALHNLSEKNCSGCTGLLQDLSEPQSRVIKTLPGSITAAQNPRSDLRGFTERLLSAEVIAVEEAEPSEDADEIINVALVAGIPEEAQPCEELCGVVSREGQLHHAAGVGGLCKLTETYGHGIRQTLQVGLAVGGHRHLCHLQIGGRHHIVGKMLFQFSTQSVDIYRHIGGEIRAEVLLIVDLTDDHRCLFDVRLSLDEPDYLVQLDAQTAELDLIVQPSEDHHIAVRIPSGIVTGAVYPLSVIVYKTLGSLLFKVFIASRHADTAYEQLAHRSAMCSRSLPSGSSKITVRTGIPALRSKGSA